MQEDFRKLLDDRGLPCGLFFSPRIIGEGRKSRGALLMLKAKRPLPGNEDRTVLTTSISLAGCDFHEAYRNAVKRLADFAFYNQPPQEALDILNATTDAFVAHYGLTLKTIQVLVDKE